MMTDGHRDNSVGERKLIWDEENRLLSVDDNGFVSNYWYDADGERTVKTSGESDQVYVNGVFSGGSTNTAKFSLYVSPYLVANQGGRYTKHIYAGSQRIVSKVGDFASYGSDPRRIEYAGSETDGLSVDYKSKYTAQQQIIKDHYQFFDVPYNGTDNNNYADGEGFCCNDGTLEAAQAKAIRKAPSRAVAKSFKDPDNYENLQFFYHPDHLGSSSFITNLDGEVVQHIEYVPFGEVFIEERNSVWNTPYLFNAKEFDEETGMYYYGARYYEPRLSIWMSTDPLSETTPDFSPYNFVRYNPVNRIDPIGLTDYDVNGEIKTIQDGHDNLKMSVGSADFISLQKAFNQGNFSYESLMNDFSVKNGFTTSEMYYDSESSSGFGISITSHKAGGQSYSEWALENMSLFYNNFDSTQGYIGAGIGSIIAQSGDIAFGNNKHLYFRNSNTGRIFNGNQYVSVTNLSKVGNLKYVARGITGISVGCGLYETYQGFEQDGHTIGYNTVLQGSKATGGLVGAYAGGKIGAAIGASVGVWFGGAGAAPGAVIGGIIGSIGGAFGGEWIGSQSAKAVMSK